MFGYCGFLLEVDLTLGKTKKVALTEELTKKYVGGSGLGAALYAQYTSDKNFAVDPLSAENPLIFMTGPMTGSTIPAANRMTVCSRSPLTNIWGESNVGGFWGPELKKAGFDGVIIKGTALQPVILCIEDGNEELISAEDLWGKDTYDTCDQLNSRGQVLAIGQSGEELVPLACIAVGKHNFFGRTGMGAVMGSKKLKAIVVKGSGKYQPASPEKIKDLNSRLRQKQKDHFWMDILTDMGSISGVDAGISSGDLPIKNWQLGEWDGSQSISSGVFKEKFTVGKHTCYACPIACKREIEVNTDKYTVPRGAGPEYETAAAFGSMCMNDDPACIAKCNELCNRYGLDTMSTGTGIALAIECFEKGYITTEDTNGMQLAWGDGEMIVELVNQIGQNRGFGALIAKGSDAFVADLDPAASELLTTVKGLPAAYHDPRLLWGLGLDYATGVVGASHVTSSVMFSELGFVVLPKVGIGLDRYIPPSKEGKAELVKLAQDYGAVYTGSASFCGFGGTPFNDDDCVNALNAATGNQYTVGDIMQIGERIWCLKRTLSNIWGIRKADDRLPKRLITAVNEGHNAGVTPAIDEMIEEYYQVRGLDENGFVRQDILKKCGLQDFISVSREAAAGEESK